MIGTEPILSNTIIGDVFHDIVLPCVTNQTLCAGVCNKVVQTSNVTIKVLLMFVILEALSALVRVVQFSGSQQVRVSPWHI